MPLEPSYLPLAVRAFAQPENSEDDEAVPQRASTRIPEHVLVFDTETTVDPTQRILFGAWRYCRFVDRDDGTRQLVCVQEGLFYPDDLPERDPTGYAVLNDYQQANRFGAADPDTLDADWRLQLMPLSRFLKEVFYRAAWVRRAAVVGFNLPFDLSRLAWSVGMPRTRDPERPNPYRGGFAFTLFRRPNEADATESKWRPRIAVKTIDSKRALKGFRPPERIDPEDQSPDEPMTDTEARKWRWAT